MSLADAITYTLTSGPDIKGRQLITHGSKHVHHTPDSLLRPKNSVETKNAADGNITPDDNTKRLFAWQANKYMYDRGIDGCNCLNDVCQKFIRDNPQWGGGIGQACARDICLFDCTRPDLHPDNQSKRWMGLGVKLYKELSLSLKSPLLSIHFHYHGF